jgi:hypothetical protein
MKMIKLAFSDEKAILRFDYSEFSGPEPKARLIASPVT